MGRVIVKLPDNRFLEWSTVVDAPTTYSVDREEAVEEWGEERIKRADRFGTSSIHGTSIESMIGFNRAGKDESCLSLTEIAKRYHPDNAPKGYQI